MKPTIPVVEKVPAGIQTRKDAAEKEKCPYEYMFARIRTSLLTQDNLMTQNPMFCVQIKVRDVGYDPMYADGPVWWNASRLERAYKTPKDLTGWECFGYKDRWETVMVAFTKDGCEEYLRLDGHNVVRRAFNGEIRIYVESFNRCPEMILIRNALIDRSLNGDPA